MTLCDLSAFYCERGGGVTTFHRARIDWFSRQTRHRYVLIAPGPRPSVRQVAPSVTLVSVYGPRASRDPGRYRLLVQYAAVREAIERYSPDVLETHDPWFSLPMGLMLRYHGSYRGLLTTHCHSDPIVTYVRPRLPAWRPLQKWMASFERWADVQLHRLHAPCDLVFASSDTMLRRLASVGLTRLAKAPFGIETDLLRVSVRRPLVPRLRLLYAGRLDDDKEFALVLAVLPRLLELTDVRVTIAGTGKYARRLERMDHPRFRYLGHVGERAAMRSLYSRHDVLLAPGRHETFGLAALEAAAAGLLVVGPAEGGTGELLSAYRSPLTFTPGSRDAFMRAIANAMNEEHSDVVRRGRTQAAQFGSWPSAVARQIAHYESMVGDPVARPVGLSA